MCVCVYVCVCVCVCVDLIDENKNKRAFKKHLIDKKKFSDVDMQSSIKTKGNVDRTFLLLFRKFKFHMSYLEQNTSHQMKPYIKFYQMIVFIFGFI